MPLNFITGAPGSGKSDVVRGMAAQGFTIYDTDDPFKTGLSGWHSLETGEYVAGFNELEVTEELLATHVWRLTDTSLAELVDRSVNELIYLCGRLRDARSVIEVSEHILFLMLPGSVIDARLTKRAGRSGEVEWGGEAWQRERSVLVNTEIEAEYRALGAVMINADQPREAVVQDIITATT